MSSRVLVLDTSAFIVGYDPLSISETQYTTQSIQKELIAEDLIWTRFKIACETGKLTLISPSLTTKDIVDKIAMDTGDYTRLSMVDKEVLAVALELQERGRIPLIISDDYSIQNMADKLKLKYVSLSTLGIRHRFNWILLCPACHKNYSPNYYDKTCNVCGTLLKRKPLKKSKNP